ncbi:hypothetical protein O5O45_08335 [Hahella aquimaris]|uniref:hypothetical protein n=1 Tax=Hahella sp. HNIBRBA332 TaxID=3015983 RepID=UPI00273C8AC6|nr:hypothetical protein [Hahella sp. HNIBRBA332]WLQ15921.1 hypothetical protein O5O45_08335 [Hahella sp. HNIBRBA332]
MKKLACIFLMMICTTAKADVTEFVRMFQAAPETEAVQLMHYRPQHEARKKARISAEIKVLLRNWGSISDCRPTDNSDYVYLILESDNVGDRVLDTSRHFFECELSTLGRAGLYVETGKLSGEEKPYRVALGPSISAEGKDEVRRVFAQLFGDQHGGMVDVLESGKPVYIDKIYRDKISPHLIDVIYRTTLNIVEDRDAIGAEAISVVEELVRKDASEKFEYVRLTIIELDTLLEEKKIKVAKVSLKKNEGHWSEAKEEINEKFGEFPEIKININGSK